MADTSKFARNFAAIYVRTSSEHQGEKASPDEQEADCRSVAEQNGLTVYKVYRDIERYRVKGRLVDPSGTRFDRPQLQAMLKDGAAGRFGVIIAWREDRLYRGMRSMLYVLDEVQAHNIIIILARETFDVKMAPIKAWVAGMELDGMRERLTMGVKARLRAGKANSGQDRYGYRRNGEVIEIVEEEAYWVQKIYEWYTQGVKMHEIRQRLIDLGAPQKGSTNPRRIPWAIHSIQSILKAASEYHFGYKIQRRAGEAFRIAAPPIIDARVYKRYLEIRRMNTTHPLRNVRHDYLVAGLVRCDCGRSWSGRTQSYPWRINRKGEKVLRKSLSSVYACTQQHKELIHPDCPRTIGHMKLDDYVWARVMEVLNDPIALIDGARDYVDELRQQASDIGAEKDRLLKQMESLMLERQWVITQARRGGITTDDMDYQLGEISAQENALQQELVEVQEIADYAISDDWEEVTLHYLGELKLRLEKLNAVPQTEEEQREQFELRRQVVNMLIEQVYILKDRKIKIVFRLNLPVQPLRADQVQEGEIYTHTQSRRGRRHPGAGGA